MDYKKNEIIKSLEELSVTFNNNIDCSQNPKLCNFNILLAQTINKTILYLESKNKYNNVISPDININYAQLSNYKK